MASRSAARRLASSERAQRPCTAGEGQPAPPWARTHAGQGGAAGVAGTTHLERVHRGSAGRGSSWSRGAPHRVQTAGPEKSARSVSARHRLPGLVATTRAKCRWAILHDTLRMPATSRQGLERSTKLAALGSRTAALPKGPLRRRQDAARAAHRTPPLSRPVVHGLTTMVSVARCANPPVGSRPARAPPGRQRRRQRPRNAITAQVDRRHPQGHHRHPCWPDSARAPREQTNPDTVHEQSVFRSVHPADQDRDQVCERRRRSARRTGGRSRSSSLSPRRCPNLRRVVADDRGRSGEPGVGHRGMSST